MRITRLERAAVPAEESSAGLRPKTLIPTFCSSSLPPRRSSEGVSKSCTAARLSETWVEEMKARGAPGSPTFAPLAASAERVAVALDGAPDSERAPGGGSFPALPSGGAESGVVPGRAGGTEEDSGGVIAGVDVPTTA